MRILHTADTHLGARQYGLDERRADFSKAFLQVVKIAIEEQVQAVIHSGDLFDDRYPTAEDLHETLQALFKLKQASIPFLGVVGNHEQRRGVQWLDLFAQLELAVHLRGEPYELEGFRFYGMDYEGRREVKPLHIRGGVLVCHQLLDSVRYDGELHYEDLIRCGAQYVLLGDYHEHRVWREKGMLITYPGSTERWNVEEREPRGVSLIDLDTGRLDRRELATRSFLYISEDEDPLKGLEALRHKLKGAVVCVYLGRSRYDVQELEGRARSLGAIALRIIDHGEALEAEAEAPQVELPMDPGSIESLISERLSQMNLSKTALDIDSIIRNPKIADSNVDPEVTKLLEAKA